MSDCDILLVEDDLFKREMVISLLRERLPSRLVTLADSVSAAVQLLKDNSFDLLILDMSLPSHEPKPGSAGVASLLSGGLEVIMELAYQAIDTPVIILTQYREVEIESKLVPLRLVKKTIASTFDIQIRDALHFDRKTQVWAERLIELVGTNK